MLHVEMREPRQLQMTVDHMAESSPSASSVGTSVGMEPAVDNVPQLSAGWHASKP